MLQNLEGNGPKGPRPKEVNLCLRKSCRPKQLHSFNLTPDFNAALQYPTASTVTRLCHNSVYFRPGAHLRAASNSMQAICRSTWWEDLLSPFSVLIPFFLPAWSGDSCARRLWSCLCRTQACRPSPQISRCSECRRTCENRTSPPRSSADALPTLSIAPQLFVLDPASTRASGGT